jgi:hypothetical protein
MKHIALLGPPKYSRVGIFGMKINHLATLLRSICLTIPNGHEVYNHFALLGPPKYSRVGIFGIKINHLATLLRSICLTIPNGHEVYNHFALLGPPKYSRVGIFGMKINQLATLALVFFYLEIWLRRLGPHGPLRVLLLGASRGQHDE